MEISEEKIKYYQEIDTQTLLEQLEINYKVINDLNNLVKQQKNQIETRAYLCELIRIIKINNEKIKEIILLRTNC